MYFIKLSLGCFESAMESSDTEKRLVKNKGKYCVLVCRVTYLLCFVRYVFY